MPVAQHPRRIDEITAEWMTRALREGGVCRASIVEDIRIQPIGGGFGFLSGLARVELDFDSAEPDVPRSVVVKLPASAESNRQTGDSFRAYEREVRFYREIAPQSDVRTTRCYYSVLEPEQDRYVLVLEDVSSMTLGDQVKGVTIPQARDALRTIGGFHAQWWKSPRLDELTWMPTHNLDLPHLFSENWHDFRNQFAAELGGAEARVGDRVSRHGQQIADLMAAAPRTIVHWDYRADNLVFDETTKEEPVVVLDWQLAQRAMGAFDATRLICGSVTTKLQGHRHRELLTIWHETLCAKGVDDYPFEQAWREYQIGLLIALYLPVAFHHVASYEGGRGLEFARATMHRLFHAAVECDADAVLVD